MANKITLKRLQSRINCFDKSEHDYILKHALHEVEDNYIRNELKIHFDFLEKLVNELSEALKLDTEILKDKDGACNE